MQSIKEKINGDLTSSMKAKDAVKVSALRLVLSAIKNREIEFRGAGKMKLTDSLPDADVMQVLSGMAKQRRESIEMFEQGGRHDLSEKEAAELNILMSYLPQQLSEKDVEKVVVEIIKETSATGIKDMGQVMKLVMAKVAGKADGKMVSEVVRRNLN
ncbi:MAG: glutamyl-tRNA amidotransferase [Deltaproteobacteria bacterium CG07_land_8_20_14_0_80_38_7]|nr:MAG: glutamyl-tRNA amidotransferase [Deltaproteobacteria bacterium CG07_land_8_20_14_0_80_38_7]